MLKRPKKIPSAANKKRGSNAAPPMSPHLFPHHDIELENGLRLLLAPLEHVHRTVASLYLRAGPRFETTETNGLSHFLEHMVFRGTDRFPSAHAQALAFERLGTTLYAATHVDHGVMSVSIPPRNVEPVLRLLGEVVVAPRFSDIDIERGIVREEILEDRDEDGADIDADNLSRALMYESHPLGFSITGGIEALDRFDENMLRIHHAKHYCAQNAVLCISGRIDDLDQCIQIVEQSFGGMPRGERVRTEAPGFTQKRPRFQSVETPSSQTDLRLCFRAPGEKDKLEPAVDMLLRVLDDGMSTRLYERICDRLGLCYDVSGTYEPYEDDGVVDLAAEVQHERAPKVVKELLGLVRELCEHGPTAEEMEKALNRHGWSVEAMADDAESVAGFYGLGALTNTKRSPWERHEELSRVSAEGVRDAAREIFRGARMSAVAVGMLTRGDEQKVEKLIKGFGAG